MWIIQKGWESLEILLFPARLHNICASGVLQLIEVLGSRAKVQKDKI